MKNKTRQSEKSGVNCVSPSAATVVPIRPARLGVVSDLQLEARRKLGMVWFMHKRDQQEDWG